MSLQSVLTKVVRLLGLVTGIRFGSWALWVYRLLTPPPIPGPRLLTTTGLVDPRTQSGDTALATREDKEDLGYAEDVVIWDSKRLAIFSADPGRPVYNPFADEGDAKTAPSARILVYDLDTRERRPLQIEGWPEGRTFHSLGVGILEEQEGEGNSAILAITNLGADFTAVEMVRLHATPTTSSSGNTHYSVTGTFLHTLAHPKLTTPNAVVPLSADQVLVTNSFGLSPRLSKLLNVIEMYIALPVGSILCLTREKDHTTCSVVANGLSLANGLAASDDGRVLVAAGCTSMEVRVYDVSPPLWSGAFDPKSVQFREALPAGFLVDNLSFAGQAGHQAHEQDQAPGGQGRAQSQAQAQGEYTFLAAGHPHALRFAACAATKGAKPAGSKVAKLTIAPAAHREGISGLFLTVYHVISAELNRLAFCSRVDRRVSTVFEDDGGLLATASTAAAFVPAGEKRGTGTGMVVTGLWDKRGVLWCEDVDI